MALSDFGIAQGLSQQSSIDDLIQSIKTGTRKEVLESGIAGRGHVLSTNKKLKELMAEANKKKSKWGGLGSILKFVSNLAMPGLGGTLSSGLIDTLIKADAIKEKKKILKDSGLRDTFASGDIGEMLGAYDKSFNLYGDLLANIGTGFMKGKMIGGIQKGLTQAPGEILPTGGLDISKLVEEGKIDPTELTKGITEGGKFLEGGGYQLPGKGFKFSGISDESPLSALEGVNLPDWLGDLVKSKEGGAAMSSLADIGFLGKNPWADTSYYNPQISGY